MLSLPIRVALWALLLAQPALTWPALAQKDATGPLGDPKGAVAGVPAAVPRRAAPPAFTRLPDPVPAGVEESELQAQADDPPTRVGRVARVQGTVSIRPQAEEDWAPARLNDPVFGGYGLWTEPGSRAAVEFGRSRLFLDGGTDFGIAAAEEGALRATLPRGAVLLQLRGLEEDDGLVEVVTPDAVVETAVDGRVLIEALGEGAGTAVSVFEGAAEVTAGSQTVSLQAGQSLRVNADGTLLRGRAGAGTPLVAWAAGSTPRQAPPQAARRITGIDELASHGRWDTVPEYGDVWYPRAVPTGWVPYSDGAWQWQERFGWSWRDAAPWGFATSHYGRWVQVGPRWGWAPAPVRVAGLPRLRPAWSPALVAFFGAPPRPGFADRPVGWVPLGPREPYYPWFRASPAYVQRVNLRQVVDLRDVRRDWDLRRRAGEGRGDERGADRRPDFRFDDRRDGGPPGRERFDRYVHRRAATVADATAFREGRDMSRAGRRLEPGRPGEDRPLLEGLPLRPGPRTIGLTPRLAEQVGVSRDELRGIERPRAPGPDARAGAALLERRREAERAGRPGRDASGRDPRDRDLRDRDLRDRDLRDRDRGDRDRGDRDRGDRDRGGGRGPVAGREDGPREGRPERDAGEVDQRRDRPEGPRPPRDAAAAPGLPERGLRDGPRRDPQDGRDAAATDRAERTDAELRARALRERLRAERAPAGVAPAARPADAPEGGRGEPPRLARESGRERPPGDPDSVGNRPPRDAGDRARQLRQRQEAAPAEGLRRRPTEAPREGVTPDPRDEARRAREAQQVRPGPPTPPVAEPPPRGRADQELRPGIDPAQREAERARRQQERRAAEDIREQAGPAQRQRDQGQVEQARQQERLQRQQAEQAQRQQAEQAQRQQLDQGRRQQEQAQRQQAEQAQRQQLDQGRRQQEQAQRQQAEQAQRQQLDQARRQQEQAQRQQEQAQRQQLEQARRQHQEQAQRQQAEQAQRQQEQARRQQEQAQRQQEVAQRQQELAQRQQEQARRQQEQAQRQERRQQEPGGRPPR